MQCCWTTQWCDLIECWGEATPGTSKLLQLLGKLELSTLCTWQISNLVKTENKVFPLLIPSDQVDVSWSALSLGFLVSIVFIFLLPHISIGFCMFLTSSRFDLFFKVVWAYIVLFFGMWLGPGHFPEFDLIILGPNSECMVICSEFLSSDYHVLLLSSAVGLMYTQSYTLPCSIVFQLAAL